MKYEAYFAAYNPDGSGRVWYPTYYRTPKMANKVMPIIKAAIEETPLTDRRIAGCNKQYQLSFHNFPADNHDMCHFSIGIDSKGVTIGGGSDKIPSKILMARLMDFVRGGCK